MAEAIVSAIIEQLVSILHQQAEEGIRLIVGAEEEAEKLTSKFRAIKAVLEDAESKQVKDVAVRDWLDKLKDVSYDIDDVLDEWNTAMQKLRLKEVENGSKVCSLMTTCRGFSCGRVIFRYDIGAKIKNLNRKLDVIAVEKDRFNFSSTKGTIEIERPITASVIDVSEICGRDEDRTTLMNLLLSESVSEGPTIPTISIVGMGGIGKTTLARLAFNDDKVKAHFEKKIWVCVSEPFNETRIAKAILESLNETANFSELETVLRKIRQFIEGKKFLLVLDDVWTENPSDWEQIKHTVICGSPESRILITTRKQKVADVIGTSHTIPIGTLPHKECWSLFSRLALSERTTEECGKLKEIGEKIVEKCKGLPLAVKSLGSLLRFKRKSEEWQSILDSETWELEEVERDVFPPLLFSYYDLSPALRKCFSYCAIFPKDHEFDRLHLIRLWMAQGYLNAEPNKDPEEVGEKYFEILATRSFFQDFEKYDNDDSKIESCKMHDIVHDLAQFLTKNECFSIEGNDVMKSEYKKARHAIVYCKRGDPFPPFVYTMKSLRTLIVVGKNVSFRVIDLSKLFNELTCLRTLDLYGLRIKKIPRRIEKLIHLRYLSLQGNILLKELPEALCELRNLQVLDVDICERLERLPKGIGKLINLRDLLNDGTSLSYMPKGMERLTNLRRIEEFVVSDGVGGKASKLECLQKFDHLKEVSIQGMGNSADVGEQLPPLGKLPSLESLKIVKMKTVRRVDDEFLGIESGGNGSLSSSSSSIVAFPKLKRLEFYKMEEWEEWDYGITKTGEEQITIMPCLRSLRIRGCPKLKSMPSHLLPMTRSSNFQMLGCPLLEEYLKQVEVNGKDGISSSSS